MKYPPVPEAEFLASVEKHQMMVVLDTPMHRHLRFTQPNTGICAFDLITWPGHLCYTGDMGTYVFSRLNDMFTFFRQDPEWTLGEGETLVINPSYWAEKLQAVDKTDGFEEFSADRFRAVIAEWLDESGATDSVRQAVQEQVLSKIDEGEHAAFSAAVDFEHEGFCFQDFWEVDCTEYTYRFIWCCYALVWGIGFYDEMKAATAAAAAKNVADLPAPEVVQ